MKSYNLTMKQFRALAFVPKEDEWPREKRKEPVGRPMNDEAWPSVERVDYLERDSTHALHYA